MSAYDDEFGLFGDEEGDEEERKSTLGARTIASPDAPNDEIEPEDEPVRRRGRRAPGEKFEGGGAPRFYRRGDAPQRPPIPDEIAHPRAVELLTFLAKRLVAKPEAVGVELHPDSRGAVLELEVDPEDLGKVIGRGGRVAQALRTLVRAGAEGRVTVDIVDVDDEELEEDELEADAPHGEAGETHAEGSSADA
jgi:predicted RNA-binding protein YlqC (UPF0109 family)